MTISYLPHSSLIVHPTKSVVMIKGSAAAPTLGSQGPPMHVVQATTHLGVIQTTNPDDTTLPPKVAVAPGLTPTIHVPGHQGPLPVIPKLRVLSHRGLEQL